jgi:hypothetical protein
MRDSAQRIIETVSSWDGVEAKPHRFGGVEFTLGNVEIGHIHPNMGLVDIPFTKRTREALVADGEAELHHILPETGWISFWMRGDQDADQAIRLYRLSYLIKAHRRSHAIPQAELDPLHFSAAVLDTLRRGAAETE